MKIIHRGKVVAAFGIALVAAGCGDITGVNKNPNAPEDVKVGPLFTRAVVDGVNRWHGNAFNLRGMQWLSQHFAEAAYPSEDSYAGIRGANTAGSFNGAYTAELNNLGIVIAKATAANQPGIVAPAKVFQSWGFSYLTDVWGDVPYTDALKGTAAEPVLLPKYDAQKDIYDSLFTTLAQAVTAMEGSPAGSLAQADPLFGGDLKKWQKFANSLRLRLAIRLANVDQEKTRTELQAALSAPGGVFTSVADNAKLPWPGDGVWDNPWWSGTFQSRDDHRMSKTLMDILLATNDPRTSVYAQPTQSKFSRIDSVPGSSVRDTVWCPVGGCYAGQPNAITQDKAGNLKPFMSRPGAIFYAGTTPYGTYGSGANAKTPSNLLTYAEVLFIQAEAAERGFIAGDAKTLYEAGIYASMEQWGITDAARITAFLADPAIAYQGGTPGLKQIAVQKWIALYTDGAQVWSEWRRTCQPTTVKAGPEAIIDYVPRRYEYSTTETSANKVNVNAAIARQGPDNFATRMYWDTDPEKAPTYVDAATCAGKR